MHGSPDDFRYLVDQLHRAGIGVLVDWVPGHFPKDDWALAHFDGTALYEHADPRLGEHQDWGTLIFNYGRHEVRNFLLANALYWIEEFHIDGLRVDAVASMLYLDYARKEGEWVTNRFGGRENLEAVDFIKQANELVYRHHPSVMLVAEESTSWPAVSRPTYLGRTRLRLQMEHGVDERHPGVLLEGPDSSAAPPPRAHLRPALRVHRELHPADEPRRGGPRQGVAAGQDARRPVATVREPALPADLDVGTSRVDRCCSWAARSRQNDEWHHDRSVDWHLLDYPEHAGVQALVRALNTVYRNEPALWEQDFDWPGFRWINPNDADTSVLSFLRFPLAGGRSVACVANLTPVPRHDYRIGLPAPGALGGDPQLRQRRVRRQQRPRR